MPEDVHITQIEKVGSGEAHAMYIRGVVDGKPVDGLVPVDVFQQKEREGRQALSDALKEGLSTIHEQEESQRRR